MAKPKFVTPENVGTTDVDKAVVARQQMEDTFWFKAKSGQGDTWGKNYLRILPAHKNMDGLFFWSVPIHFDVGPGRQNLPCPRRAFSQPCPVCDRSLELKKEGKKEEARDHWSSWQAYLNVIELTEEGTPAEDPPRVRVWGIGKKVLDMLLDELNETGDFTDLTTGRDVEVRRRGEKFKTEYRVKVAPEPSAVTYIETLNNLQDLRTVSPYVEASVLQKALDAPATGAGDPWAPEAALPSGEAKEADEIRQGSQRWGGDDDDVEEETSPAASNDDEREAARQHLEKVSGEAAQRAE